MTKCYECSTEVNELSPRSRCVSCEHKRAVFNERENEELRMEIELLYRWLNVGADNGGFNEEAENLIRNRKVGK